jgi:FkbM family methyltransferase
MGEAGMAAPVITVKVGLYTVKLMDDDKVAALIKQGPYEPETLKFWADACEDGKAQTAIDVGAYAGLFAISAALMGNLAIAIEPKSELTERVRKHVEMNRADNVTVLELAASNQNGAGDLHTNGSIYSFASSLTYDPVKQAHNRKRRVKVRKLDSLRCVRSKVGAIKIDVEAHEAEVIEGALGIIRRDRPALVVETMNDPERTSRVYNLLPEYRNARLCDGRNLCLLPH